MDRLQLAIKIYCKALICVMHVYLCTYPSRYMFVRALYMCVLCMRACMFYVCACMIIIIFIICMSACICNMQYYACTQLVCGNVGRPYKSRSTVYHRQ